MLAMLEPTTFPKLSSPFPFRAAVRLKASSGELVPKATMVSPMSSVETPKRRAARTAPSTSQFPPRIRRTIPRVREMGNGMR